MSTLAEPLVSRELADWYHRMTRQLNQGLTGDVRERVVAELRRDTGVDRVPFPALIGLALLDDCLRVGHLAMEADGTIEADELARMGEVARVAAPRYFTALSRYEAFGEPELGATELAEFVRFHRHDSAPLGQAGPGAWRGIRLCKQVAELTRNQLPLREHERMLVRVMDAVFAGRDADTERTARDKLRSLFERPERPGVDARAAAFCRADGPEVFSSVAHGSQIFERDPFDVPTIHAEARAIFQRQVEHAIIPSHHGAGHGRTLLVLGTAGSGKTHLLRAFRAAVHEHRLGYVGYLQMSSDVGDYARYVLTKLIDSLERPYDSPELEESALLYLSDGLVERADALPAGEVERLRTGELTPDELPSFVGRMVDRLVRVEALGDVDSDLVHALLLLQRRDPALQRRIVKFLRCEALTSYEQALLGGLAPRTQPEDPERTIVQLGRLAFELQQAALVLLIDQIEDTIPDARGYERVQRAIDVVRRIADALPSAVAVIACLEDVYDQIKPRLHQSAIDRLEREPAPVRLGARRRRDEIAEMLTLRLQHLYDELEVAWREDEPLFPFRDDQLDELSNQRARDCLAYFRKFQEQCIAAGGLIDPTLPGPSAAAADAISAAPAAPVVDLADLERAWSDALAGSEAPPDDDAGLLRLVELGARACAEERGQPLQLVLDTRQRPRLTIQLPGRPTHVVEVCNRQAQGGHLGSQIEALRRSVDQDQVAVALRTSEFAFGPKTAVMRAIGEMTKAGGLALTVEDSDLRAVAALGAFLSTHAGHPGLGAWRQRLRPMSSLTLFRKLLPAERGEPRPPAPAPATAPPAAAAPPRSPVAPPPAIRPSSASSLVRLGVTPTMRAEPVAVDLESLKTHAAFLGTTGSGKTTIALNIIEQLLERGVSVLMVDRKGDLARYASARWWEESPRDPEAARRKRELRARIDVDLYTPGESSGRPLRIPLIPTGMAEMTTQERDQVARTAASALAAMLGYGRGEAQRRREAILKKAIELHADSGGTTLDDLRDTISRPDPELLAAVGNLTRHFAALTEDLDMLAIQRGGMLAGDGDVLDVGAMLTPRDGRPRLAIISAVALTDVAMLQFFVSRLLVELARTVRRNPQPSLRTVAFFDEADAYIPAMSSPPTKEPMFELLRRARSGGLGVLLATQNPGDLDYKARDNIATWLVGKVAQDRAIEKMKNLLSGYPNVASRLASQSTGSFFVLNPALGAMAREVRTDHSLMKTEQLQEHEIATLARATIAAPP